jgi:hypothetical protein
MDPMTDEEAERTCNDFMARNRNKPVTFRWLDQWTGAWTKILGEAHRGLRDKTIELDARVNTLTRLYDARIAALEARPIVHDAGVFVDGTVYPKGAGVTWDGGFWIAQAETRREPGEGRPEWRLAVRRGKQGREGTCRCAAQ